MLKNSRELEKTVREVPNEIVNSWRYISFSEPDMSDRKLTQSLDKLTNKQIVAILCTENNVLNRYLEELKYLPLTHEKLLKKLSGNEVFDIMRFELNKPTRKKGVFQSAYNRDHITRLQQLLKKMSLDQIVEILFREKSLVRWDTIIAFEMVLKFIFSPVIAAKIVTQRNGFAPNILNALQKKNREGDTLLHIITKFVYFDQLRGIFDSLTESGKFPKAIVDILKMENSDGKNVVELSFRELDSGSILDKETSVMLLSRLNQQDALEILKVDQAKNKHGLFYKVLKSNYHDAKVAMFKALRAGSGVHEKVITSLVGDEGGSQPLVFELVQTMGDCFFDRAILQNLSGEQVVKVLQAKNANQQTPFHAVLKTENYYWDKVHFVTAMLNRLRKAATKEKIVEILNIKDDKGNTVVHLAVDLAVKKKAFFILERLFQGLDKNHVDDLLAARNNAGKTPQDIAKENGVDDIREAISALHAPDSSAGVSLAKSRHITMPQPRGGKQPGTHDDNPDEFESKKDLSSR